MKSKLVGLQVARAAAVLAIVVFHAQLILNRFPKDSYLKIPYFHSQGDIGVPLFFVISGFIIAYILAKAERLNIREFAIKRFFRLWPTYFVCTLLYMLVTLLHRDLPASTLTFTPERIIQSLIFWPMLKLPVLQPGWSLEHEVIFYIFIAIFCKLLGLKRAFFVLALSVVIGFLYRVALPEIGNHKVVWDYHLLHPVNTCFMFGVLLYFIWIKLEKSSYNASNALAYRMVFIGSSLLLVVPYIVDYLPAIFTLDNAKAKHNFYKGYARFTLESLASMIFIYGLIKIKATSIISRAFASIGDRSYSIYLVHFILIPVFQNIHRDHIDWPQQYAEFTCVLFVCFSILLGYLVHWCLELPTARYGVKLARGMTVNKI